MSKETRFKQLLNYVAKHSPFYKNVFDEKGINVQDMTLDDLDKLPFTTKDDLAKFNEAFLCVPKNQIVDYITTSGTLSNPVSFYLTENDTKRLAENECTALTMAGGTKDDIYQLMVTMDKQFMAGLAYYLGIKKMGAGAVRVGPTSPQNHLDTILRFDSTILIAIPSFIVKLIETAKKNNIDLNSTPIKSIVCIGEPIRNEDFSLNVLGERITSQWKVKLFSTYASTEMGAAFTECLAGNGGHLNEEMLLMEVVDENGKAVKDGELGEVVVTTLGVEGMPLIRYKTGDLCHIHYSKCACGVESPRLGPVVGRKQQMIKYKGTTVFPPAVFAVLEFLHISLYKVEVTKNEFGNDIITVVLPEQLNTEEKIKEITSAFKSRIRVAPFFKFMEEGKLMNIIHHQDKRKPEKIVFSS